MKKIACMGNITYDIFNYTDSFPIENERNKVNKISCTLGGPAYNAACVLGKYGCNTYFYGFIGDDAFSKQIKSDLKNSNVNYNHLEEKENFTMPISNIIVCDKNKTRTINTFRDENDNCNLSFNSLEDNYDIILTDGKYPKEFLKLKEKNKNAITIIDAGRCNRDMIKIAKECDYIICSEEFVNKLMKHLNINHKIDINNYEETFLVMMFLDRYFKNSNVAVTIGKYGYLYIDQEKHLIHEDAISFGNVKDTTAAGDIFHGAFTYAISNDMTYPDSLKYANIISSISVTKYGGNTSIPELNEVNTKIKKKNIKFK